MQDVGSFICYSDFWDARHECYACTYAGGARTLRVYPDLIGCEDRRLFVRLECEGVDYAWEYNAGDLFIRKSTGDNVRRDGYPEVIPVQYFDFWPDVPEAERPILSRILAMAVNRSRSRYASDAYGRRLFLRY